MALDINTYHCICTSLLLASTHLLSSLPRRTQSQSNDSGAQDSAIILPLPSSPPEGDQLPPEGYTLLLGLDKDPKATVVRRQDGFEKRKLHRCARCRLVVGYELPDQTRGGNEDVEMDGTTGKGKEREEEYMGKLLYILPGGVMSTEAMMTERKVGEDDVVVGKGIQVFE